MRGAGHISPFEKPSEIGRSPERRGLDFVPVTREAYSAFIIRHARSEEIGPIQTILDGQAGGLDGQAGGGGERDIRLIGLYVCGKICATAIAVLSPNKLDHRLSCKLDSIVVHRDLRRRGIAIMMATKLFKNLIEDPDLEIGNILSHAVHPATVRLLGALGFCAPPAIGAPIVNIKISGEAEAELLKICTANFMDIQNRLKH